MTSVHPSCSLGRIPNEAPPPPSFTNASTDHSTQVTQGRLGWALVVVRRSEMRIQRKELVG
ncbi:hypothetical protein D9611_009733 [Ephemerocybe angulata]|uniref:Uncharacterized protein n=1 Tax=Ephemerocybe angulata TaxID=980116 RepID=A0A8H5FGQ8_9AGAR|nr:hypothetical protein D9611_009733 [Tulosesus angulatus]